MSVDKSSLLTLAPKTLEKRLEIAVALRALVSADEDEQIQKRGAGIAALRRDLEEIRLQVAELWQEIDPRFRSYVIKYSPDQPRVPAGNSDGGQWKRDGAESPNGSPVRLAQNLRCDGFYGGCESGSNYGTNAMYHISGKSLCRDCAVKILGIGNDSSRDQTRTLSPFQINGK
jgi:hypothetical protein